MKTGKRIVSTICSVAMALSIVPSVQIGASAADRTSMTVPSGKAYILQAYCGKVVDIEGAKRGNGVNALLWKLHRGTNQQYVLDMKDTTSNGYTMRSVATGSYLDVAGISRACGANIYQWSYTGAANQLWYLEDAGKGYVYIRSGMGTYMDVSGNKTANGTNIWAYTFNATNAQKFRIKELVNGVLQDAALTTPATLGGTGKNAMGTSTSTLASERSAAWAKYKSQQLADPTLRQETQAQSISFNGKTMKYYVKVIGAKPKNGYPLYIALHGGGGCAASTNDSQWRQMQTYYASNLKCGVYVAPRGISNTWNLHFMAESYAMYERLIQYMILTRDVDPNRVYLEGFSAGADGTYQVAAKMADRFAAANASSGHPNGVSLINLKNMAFQFQSGKNDTAYSRNTIVVDYDTKLDDFARQYGGGYPHRVLVHNAGHNYADYSRTPISVLSDSQSWRKNGTENWVNVDSFPADYMDQYTRNPLPANVVWDVSVRPLKLWEANSFYYLSTSTNTTQGIIQASYDRNKNLVALKSSGLNGDFNVLLNENMVNFAKPITFQVDGRTAVVSVTPDREVLEKTTAQRGDPNYQFMAEISYDSLKKLAK